MLSPGSAAFDERVRGRFCEELLTFLCKAESLLLGENFFLLCRHLQHNVHLSNSWITSLQRGDTYFIITTKTVITAITNITPSNIATTVPIKVLLPEPARDHNNILCQNHLESGSSTRS